MDTLLELLTYVGPTAAGLLTVPILDGIKRLVSAIDSSPSAVKQTLAVVIAFGLTKLGELLQVALPGDLALFTGADVEGLLSAAIAFGVHAGKKAQAPSSGQINALAILFMAFLPAAAACQTGRATVTVVDRSRLEVVVDPLTFTGEVGDTVTFASTPRSYRLVG